MIYGIIPLTQARTGTSYLVQTISERSDQADRLREIGLIERARLLTAEIRPERCHRLP